MAYVVASPLPPLPAVNISNSPPSTTVTTITNYVDTPVVRGAPLPPGTPTLWYDMNNSDGFLNTTRVDGVRFSGTTSPDSQWSNLGSLGSAGNLYGGNSTGRPTFRLVGAAGKMNNMPAASSTGTEAPSVTFTDIPQPMTYGFILNFSSLAGTPVPYQGGSLGTDGHEIFSNSGNPEVFAGSFIQISSLTFQAGKWHMFLWQANGASSLARLDGVAASSSFNSGSAALGGAGLFAQAGVGNPMTGSIAEMIMYSGALSTQPAMTDIEAYFKDKYGSGFPQ